MPDELMAAPYHAVWTMKSGVFFAGRWTEAQVPPATDTKLFPRNMSAHNCNPH